MEFTEEQLTEIKADLEAGKPLADIFKPVAEAGVILRYKKDDDEYKTNLQKKIEEEADAKFFGKGQSDAYNKIEATVLEVTGIPKDTNEPATAYAARAYAAKLESLKDKKDEGTATNEDKELIKQLQAKIAEKEQAILDKDKTYEAERNSLRFESAIEKAFAAEHRSKLRKDIDSAILEEASNARLNKIKAMPHRYNAETKSIEFLDGEGKVIRNDSTMQPKTVSDLLNESFKDMHHVDRKQEGTGSEGKKGEAGDFSFGGITNKEDLSKKIMEAGHTRGSASYLKLYNEGRKKLKL